MGQQAKLVLVADDERAIAEVIAAFVRDLGYRATVAANGDEALTLARTEWPVLLITDMMMPRMDGPGLIAAVRAAALAERRPAPATILITAAGPGHAKGSGVDAVLRKPFDLGDLEELLRQLLTASVDTAPTRIHDRP
jgi:CheY-like chemotaxis protein